MFKGITFEKKDIHTYILLLSAPLLLTLYRYHGYPQFFYSYFPSYKTMAGGDRMAIFWEWGVFFVLMFILPLLYVKFGMKKRLIDFGLGLGDLKYGLKWLITIPIIVLPIIYFASKMPGMRVEYPMAKSLLTHPDHFPLYAAVYVLIFYVAWEFYFRGVLLFGLKDRFGAVNAILIETISSTLVHIGKPEGEIIGAIIVGILFGMIALRSKSIWYVFLIHASVGVLLDYFIIFHP